MSHNPYRQGHGGKHELAAVGFILLVFVFLVLKLVAFAKRF